MDEQNPVYTPEAKRKAKRYLVEIVSAQREEKRPILTVKNYFKYNGRNH